MGKKRYVSDRHEREDEEEEEGERVEEIKGEEKCV